MVGKKEKRRENLYDAYAERGAQVWLSSPVVWVWVMRYSDTSGHTFILWSRFSTGLMYLPVRDSVTERKIFHADLKLHTYNKVPAFLPENQQKLSERLKMFMALIQLAAV